MPRGVPKKKVKEEKAKEIVPEKENIVATGPSELEQLQNLYQEMKERGFNSIGDIEVRIARLQK